MSSDTQRTILVVEDDAATRDFLCSLFRLKAFNVVEAHNGKEGILAASRTHPDLIVMDLSMPEMDGIEAVRHIQQVPKLTAIPVFAVTAYGVGAVKEDALAAGCKEVFDKPVDVDLLLKKVEEVLRVIPSREVLQTEQKKYLFTRKVERVQTAIPIDWGLTEACHHHGTITSLSVRGCLIKTDMIEPLFDKPIFIQFPLPDDEQMLLRGAVLYYLKGAGFAVEFKDLSDDNEAVITRIVEQRHQIKLKS